MLLKMSLALLVTTRGLQHLLIPPTVRPMLTPRVPLRVTLQTTNVHAHTPLLPLRLAPLSLLSLTKRCMTKMPSLTTHVHVAPSLLPLTKRCMMKNLLKVVLLLSALLLRVKALCELMPRMCMNPVLMFTSPALETPRLHVLNTMMRRMIVIVSMPRYVWYILKVPPLFLIETIQCMLTIATLLLLVVECCMPPILTLMTVPPI